MPLSARLRDRGLRQRNDSSDASRMPNTLLPTWPRSVSGRASGLSAEQTVRLVEEAGRSASLTRLSEPAYWGRSINDDRYLVASLATS
jgi:hypothetical protein